MRDLSLHEVEFVSGGSTPEGGEGDGGQFTDGQCVAAGAGMGLAGGLGAIAAGMAVGSVVPGAGTLVGGAAGLVVATATGIFTWVCMETNGKEGGSNESDQVKDK